MNKGLLRKLPKIDELLLNEEVNKNIEEYGRNLVLDTLRESIDAVRKQILNGEIEDFQLEEVVSLYKSLLNRKLRPHLTKVINGAGIVIHTNLGRSLLCEDAVKAVEMVSKSYNNLE